jgi:hypothetical protein
MNAATRSAAIARHAVTPLRVAVPATAALAAIALTGCSSPSPAAPGVPAHKAVALSTSPPASRPATPPPAATPTATMPSAAAAAAASTAPASPAAQPEGALSATVTILGGGSGLVPGGPAVRFRVTVTNKSAQTYSNLLPLVSLGHCTCTKNTLFPAGTLQERESTSNVWQTLPYDVEGFGTDYLKADEPGGIQLISPGGVATFEYRVALKPATSVQVTRGQATLDVTLITLPGHTPVGQTPSGRAPIGVQSGQPPA